MTYSYLEFLLEEESMATFLRTWLNRYLQGCAILEFQAFSGGSDLKKNIHDRLTGYNKMLSKSSMNYRVFIMLDSDGKNCKTLKEELERKCKKLRLRTPRSERSAAPGSGRPWQVATCIVIKELEAWYLGNWSAVKSAYPEIPDASPQWTGYPNPDAVSGKTKDVVHTFLTKHSDIYTNEVPSLKLAREVGEHFDEQECNSQSFKYFLRLIDEAV